MDNREKILLKAYDEVSLQGFQGLRADKLLVELKLSKGTLYHYFPHKLAIGYTIVEEIVEPNYVNRWLPIANFEGNPIDYVLMALEHMQKSETTESIKQGCVLTNLIQEMSPLDEEFRMRLQRILDRIHHVTTQALERGQTKQQVSTSVTADKLAHFIQASIEGSYSIAKVRQNLSVFKASIENLTLYLVSLKI